jgi:hypothetical protein
MHIWYHRPGKKKEITTVNRSLHNLLQFRLVGVAGQIDQTEASCRWAQESSRPAAPRTSPGGGSLPRRARRCWLPRSATTTCPPPSAPGQSPVCYSYRWRGRPSAATGRFGSDLPEGRHGAGNIQGWRMVAARWRLRNTRIHRREVHGVRHEDNMVIPNCPNCWKGWSNIYNN